MRRDVAGVASVSPTSDGMHRNWTFFTLGLFLACSVAPTQARPPASPKATRSAPSLAPGFVVRGSFHRADRRSSAIRPARRSLRLARRHQPLAPLVVRDARRESPWLQPRASSGRATKSSDSLLTAKPGGLVLFPTRGLPPAPDRQRPSFPPERKAEPEKSPVSPGMSGSASLREDAGLKKKTDEAPTAVPMPGKTGYVRLTGKHSGFPEIDVRGIASGTLVEIPDPDTPGAAIQFRVP